MGSVGTVGALAALALTSAAAPAPSARTSPPVFSLPLACTPGRTCEVQHYVDRDPGPGVRDYRCGPQTYEGHNGTDFRIPDMAAQRRGVDVLAAAAGRVSRLRDGVADVSVRATGSASIAGQDCGNGVVIDHGGGWETQSCHMARGSVRVKVGDLVPAGTAIGRVGLSGNTEFPHLHFTVRHDGVTVDPFAPQPDRPGCAVQGQLWSPGVRESLNYRAGAILNAGFAGSALTMEQLEAGRIALPSGTSSVLVAYVRSIALRQGDVVILDLRGPDGRSLARREAAPLARWRAQDLVYVGMKRPISGWPAGRYVADYQIVRLGQIALKRQFEVQF